jgi:small subunit ribosomal protein S18
MTKKIKLKISARLVKKKQRRQGFGGAKHCRFCTAGEHASIDYKNANLLRNFLTERGKILPSRISGNCSLHQRSLASAIRKSRVMALIPYSTGQAF